MSSTIFKIISIDSAYVPNEGRIADTLQFLKAFYDDELIEASILDQIEFVDQGANFESVSCNICRSVIDIDYWQSQMNEANEFHFQNLNFSTQCCNETTSLNDLKYQTTAGFAKFVICIRDPVHELDSKQLHFLEGLLGTEDPKRTNADPYFGWIQTMVPTYGDTLHIKSNAIEQNVGIIPEIKVSEPLHPLTADQEKGITYERALQIVAEILKREHNKN